MTSYVYDDDHATPTSGKRIFAFASVVRSEGEEHVFTRRRRKRHENCVSFTYVSAVGSEGGEHVFTKRRRKHGDM